MTNKLKTTASTPETPRGQWFLEMIGIEGLQYPKLVFITEDGESLIQIKGWQTAMASGTPNRCTWFVDVEVGGMEKLAEYEELERQITLAFDEMMAPILNRSLPPNPNAKKTYERLQNEQAALRKSLTYLTVSHVSYGGFKMDPLDKVALLGEIRLKLQVAESSLSPTINSLDQDLWIQFCDAAMAYGNFCYADAAEPAHPDAVAAQDYGQQAAAALVGTYGAETAYELVEDGSAGAVADVLLNGEPGEA